MYQMFFVSALVASMLIGTAAMAQTYSYDPSPAYHSDQGYYSSHHRIHHDED